jgi:hypothetical protein
MPLIALPLGLVGLVPLIFLAFGAVGPTEESAVRMVVSLVDYAALVLAFVGGMHWGMSLHPDTQRPSLRMGVAVLPLIVAWIALVLGQFVAPSVALMLLITGYLATILTEQRAAAGLLFPPRYMAVRWVFSVVAVMMMAMVLMLRGVGQTIVF